IWLGRADGSLTHTSNANSAASANWLNVSVPGALAGKVSGIAIDPFNTAQIIAVYSSGKVFMTTNNGKTWSDISGNLPGMPLSAVVIDPNASPHTIIVATDAGV